MLKLMCPVAFCLLVVGVTGAVDPTCDGTAPQKGKCNNGTVPQGWYEAGACQPPGEGVQSCLHAIAFNQDYFSCSAPQLDNTRTPPSYTTYCADSATSVECTNQRICAAVVTTRSDGSQFTTCVQQGAVTVTYKLVKGTLSYNNSLGKCTEFVPTPGAG